jgi:hypothetical protein
MDVVAHIVRAQLNRLPRRATGEADGAEARFLEWPEGVGDDEFAERDAGRLAEKRTRSAVSPFDNP